MSTNSVIRLTLAYNQTDFTRNIAMSVEDSTAASVDTITNKIDAINASLAAGTDDGMSTFFLSDDYDGVGGTLARIKSAQVETVEETTIF